jgi:hypothetical protein
MTNHIEHLRDQSARLARLIEVLAADNVGPATSAARETWEALVRNQLEDLRDTCNGIESLTKF